MKVLKLSHLQLLLHLYESFDVLFDVWGIDIMQMIDNTLHRIATICYLLLLINCKYNRNDLFEIFNS